MLILVAQLYDVNYYHIITLLFNCFTLYYYYTTQIKLCQAFDFNPLIKNFPTRNFLVPIPYEPAAIPMKTCVGLLRGSVDVEGE